MYVAVGDANSGNLSCALVRLRTFEGSTNSTQLYKMYNNQTPKQGDNHTYEPPVHPVVKLLDFRNLEGHNVHVFIDHSIKIFQRYHHKMFCAATGVVSEYVHPRK